MALIYLNALLLVVLGLVTLGPGAKAQAARSRGQYLMVGGKYVLNQAGVAYILDQSNQELVSLSWNDGSKTCLVLVIKVFQNWLSKIKRRAKTDQCL